MKRPNDTPSQNQNKVIRVEAPDNEVVHAQPAEDVVRVEAGDAAVPPPSPPQQQLQQQQLQHQQQQPVEAVEDAPHEGGGFEYLEARVTDREECATPVPRVDVVLPEEAGAAAQVEEDPEREQMLAEPRDIPRF